MVKTEAEGKRMLKSATENWLSWREPSGGTIAQGVGDIWVVISQFFKMPVRPRCLHQILTTCQTNHFVVHYNCSCLCIMQNRGASVCVCVCVCQFFRNQTQTTLRSRGRAETHQINHNGLMDELMDSS